MTKKTRTLDGGGPEVLHHALKECTDLRDYIRNVQVKINSMEESADRGVYEYAGGELMRISVYVSKIKDKISDYISRNNHGDIV
jgi:hypothetical protein